MGMKSGFTLFIALFQKGIDSDTGLFSPNVEACSIRRLIEFGHGPKAKKDIVAWPIFHQNYSNTMAGFGKFCPKTGA